MLPENINDFEYILTWIYDYNKNEAHFLIHNLILYELRLNGNEEYNFISYKNKSLVDYSPTTDMTYGYLNYKYETEDIILYILKNKIPPIGDILQAQNLIKNTYKAKIRKNKIKNLLK